MPRALATPPAVAARDAALRRLRRVRRAIATGTGLLAVALTVLASRGFPGHTPTAAAHAAGTPDTKTHALRRPATDHRLAARPATSGNRHRSRKRLAQPAAPPATAQTTTTTAPAPVVSGGS
jgi:hypothetical protein